MVTKMAENTSNGRRRSDGWRTTAIQMSGLLIATFTLLGVASKLFGIEIVGGEQLKARVAAIEVVNTRQDSDLGAVKSDLGAVLRMSCIQTRRTEPDALPAECDRVLSSQRSRR